MSNTAAQDAPTATGAAPGPGSTMAQVMRDYPGARRALFARYHFGGCQSCGFSPEESLAELCARNGGLPVPEVIDHILASHRHDQAVLIRPSELAALLARQPADAASDLVLLDLRTREEFEAVHLPGARLLGNDLTQSLIAAGPGHTQLVVYDHTGDRCLDAAAYFIGHGLTSTRALAGGIDAYATEVDPSLPRYRVELDG